ncbi:hypothetical protein PENTCL1PPCAC_29912, partial [Pristionchus entomophagus]
RSSYPSYELTRFGMSSGTPFNFPGDLPDSSDALTKESRPIAAVYPTPNVVYYPPVATGNYMLDPAFQEQLDLHFRELAGQVQHQRHDVQLKEQLLQQQRLLNLQQEQLDQQTEQLNARHAARDATLSQQILPIVQMAVQQQNRLMQQQQMPFLPMHPPVDQLNALLQQQQGLLVHRQAQAAPHSELLARRGELWRQAAAAQHPVLQASSSGAPPQQLQNPPGGPPNQGVDERNHPDGDRMPNLLGNAALLNRLNGGAQSQPQIVGDSGLQNHGNEEPETPTYDALPNQLNDGSDYKDVKIEEHTVGESCTEEAVRPPEELHQQPRKRIKSEEPEDLEAAKTARVSVSETPSTSTHQMPSSSKDVKKEEKDTAVSQSAQAYGDEEEEWSEEEL